MKVWKNRVVVQFFSPHTQIIAIIAGFLSLHSLNSFSQTNPETAKEQQAVLGSKIPTVSSHTTDPGAQWFPKAGLGLFIHWGVASVNGNLDLSWGMRSNTRYDSAAKGANKVTPEEYWKLAERFNPDSYDPDKWIKAAAEAGFQYAVLTTVHHDGYTLWPSKFSEIGVQKYLNGRDLVKPFVDACRKYGLKVGIYVSPPDWYFDRKYMKFDTGTATVTLPKPDGHDDRRREMLHGRVEELLTRYGRIDILWFDGGVQDNAIRDRARQLQPHIVINSRSCDGDFDCTECKFPENKFSGWFETCHCWQMSDLVSPYGGTVDFWGYLKDEKYKSTAWMLTGLVRLRTWGGNFLVNVGPRPNGELPEVVYQRFAETARWMAHSSRSVIGTEAGPYPELCNVPVTTDETSWYLHALPGWTGVMEIRGLKGLSDVTLLRTGERIPAQWSEGVIRIEIPQKMRTELDDVVRIRKNPR
jgi:alpha-L-fucosidase